VEERFEKRTDPRDQTYYWLDGAFRLKEQIEDADAHKVSEGYVSITPVQFDLTAYKAIEQLRRWDLKV
jgi:5'-nucleotidase